MPAGRFCRPPQGRSDTRAEQVCRGVHSPVGQFCLGNVEPCDALLPRKAQPCGAVFPENAQPCRAEYGKMHRK